MQSVPFTILTQQQTSLPFGHCNLSTRYAFDVASKGVACTSKLLQCTNKIVNLEIFHRKRVTRAVVTQMKD